MTPRNANLDTPTGSAQKADVQKLGEVGRELPSYSCENNCNESCPEVDGVAYMPEVYKISMVRMTVKSLTNPRM